MFPESGTFFVRPQCFLSLLEPGEKLLFPRRMRAQLLQPVSDPFELQPEIMQPFFASVYVAGLRGVESYTPDAVARSFVAERNRDHGLNVLLCPLLL
jgi:hypothetical protein